MKRILILLSALPLLISSALSARAEDKTLTNAMSQTEFAVLGGGCFWCTEALFQMLSGVKGVVSGYAGGKTENPTYKEVCSGQI
jgi:peptide-methionine (S)-S-oxide reductase